MAASLALAVGMVPGKLGFAQVEPQISVPQEMFAMADELKDPAIFSLAEAYDNKVGRIQFGNNNWLIAGWDTAPNSGQPGLVLFSADKLVLCYFQNGGGDERTYEAPAGTGYGDSATTQTVYINHWGISNLRVQLNNLFEGDKLFTTDEKSYMLPSAITTEDTKNNVNYITKDVIYEILSLGNLDTVTSLLVAGEANDIVIKDKYWPKRLDMCWLRSVYSDGVLICNLKSGLITDINANATAFHAVAAFKLNIDNILFASAASHETATSENFSLISTETPMTFRVKGTTELPEASVNAVGLKLTYSAPSGSRLMVIAATEDGSTYQFSKSIDTAVTNGTSDLKNVAGDLKGKTVAARAWIEKDFSGRLTYATEPISFSAEFPLPKPTIDDFIFTAPSNLNFDGSQKQAIIKPKDGIKGMGAITIKYYKVNLDGTTTALTAPPTDAGRYKVKFDVAKGTAYAAATDLPAVFLPI